MCATKKIVVGENKKKNLVPQPSQPNCWIAQIQTDPPPDCGLLPAHTGAQNGFHIA